MPAILFLALLTAAMALITSLPASAGLFPPARLSVGFGFLLLASHVVGVLFSRIRLPRISGYIATGIVCGPFVLGFIDAELAKRMKLIDDLALTFIALTAGAELRLSVLRQRARSIGVLIPTLTLVVGAGVAATVVLLGDVLPFAAGVGRAELFAMGAVLGIVAVARSPTTAIALVSECRARGPFTDTVFGVTVAGDLLVILLFAFTVSIAQALLPAGRGLNLLFLSTVVAQLASSLALGAAIGKGVSFYLRRVEKNASILLIVLAFLIAEASRWLSHTLDSWLGVSFHLEPLLIAAAAGFTVQNFTGQGRKLKESLEAVALPIFVIFFSMAGAALNLDALARTWQLAFLFVAVRMGLSTAGGYVGAALAGEDGRFRRLVGFGFYTQAGVSLGLAQEIVRRFPEWDPGLVTFLVACITVNEILGPIAFKFALDRIGESGRAGGPADSS